MTSLDSYTEHMDLSLSKATVAVLFYRGEAVAVDDLCKVTKSTREQLALVIAELREKLGEFGLTIVETDDKVELRTSAEASELIESIRREELSRDLGKAGLETLSIILYNGPVTRADIDYIRGVNSTAILRNLLIRDLVEKVQNPNDQRSFLYKPSIELLSQLGISGAKELPDYQQVVSELELFKASQEEKTL